MEKQHKFDFRKFGKDTAFTAFLLTPGLVFGLMAFWQKWFAFGRECVERKWVHPETNTGVYRCVEYVQTHSLPEFLILALASLLFLVFFWFVVAGVIELGSAFLDRYVVCEEKSEEDNSKKTGDSE